MTSFALQSMLDSGQDLNVVSDENEKHEFFWLLCPGVNFQTDNEERLQFKNWDCVVIQPCFLAAQPCTEGVLNMQEQTLRVPSLQTLLAFS